MKRSLRNLGFALVTVFCVIGLTASVFAAVMVSTRVAHCSEDAKVAAAKSDIATLESALKLFRLDCGRYPTSKEGLKALRLDQRGLEKVWKGPYIAGKVPLDPWGHAYVYKNPAHHGMDSYIVESYGSDGRPGGAGEAADIIGGSE